MYCQYYYQQKNRLQDAPPEKKQQQQQQQTNMRALSVHYLQLAFAGQSRDVRVRNTASFWREIGKRVENEREIGKEECVRNERNLKYMYMYWLRIFCTNSTIRLAALIVRRIPCALNVLCLVL